MRKVIAAISFVLLTAGVFGALYLFGPSEHPQVSSGESDSERTAKLNDAFINYVRLGEVARNAPDGELLALGHMTCQARDNYPEQVIILNIELEYPYAGRRIYDGATQYLCDTF